MRLLKKNRSIIKRLFLGLKHGFTTPTLPSDKLELHNNPFIRLLRVLGGISFFLLIGHRLDSLGSGILHDFAIYLCFSLTTLFLIYSIYIGYYRVKFMAYVLKNKSTLLHDHHNKALGDRDIGQEISSNIIKKDNNDK